MSASNNNPPYLDPANNGTLAGMLRVVVGKMLQDTNNMLPAKVIAFDRVKNRVTVQPVVAMVSTNGNIISRAQIDSVPVFECGGGGFVINFNLNPGDLGWILANDRDISLFLQSYTEQPPNTYRSHSFSDAIFFPDVMRGYTISGEDQTNGNMVIQKNDGTVRIALWSNQVKITAPNGLVVDGPISTNAGLTVTGNISVTGQVNSTGGKLKIGNDFEVLGNITATGSITPNVPP